MVTDLETPWQNSVVERHGALFKMAFEKACSLEAPTTEAEVNESVDTATVLAQTLGRYGSFNHGPGYRVRCRISTPVPIQGILHVVTDLETPWQNSVVERHGALSKMAFEKACSLEAPTTEAEVNESVD